MEMVNGYVFLDLTKANVYAKALKVLGTDKPVVIKDGSGSPYFVDSLTLDGTNVVITKGGKTITIANNNTITSEGLVANPTMENIVDLAGNKRFVEGVITMDDVTGVTQTYGKWSLSGSHLMIVLSGNIDDGTVLTSPTTLASISLEDYIYSNIQEIMPGLVEFKSILVFGTDTTTQSLNISLKKDSDDVIKIDCGSLTASKDRYFRIQFDLLIA